MATIVAETGQFVLPAWVVDIDSFRRWRDSDSFPEHGSIWWLNGEVWADMSREQVFTHLAVKQEYSLVLGGLAKAGKMGRFFPDGLLLSNFEADISGNPDGTFISYATLQSDRIRLIEGKDGGCVEIQGTPDMVLEVLSKGSEKKDKVALREAYWKAHIPEYWLVDARSEPASFDILQYSERGYVTARKRDGWSKSVVFGKSFRLKQIKDALGHPDYVLEIR